MIETIDLLKGLDNDTAKTLSNMVGKWVHDESDGQETLSLVRAYNISSFTSIFRYDSEYSTEERAVLLDYIDDRYREGTQDFVVPKSCNYFLETRQTPLNTEFVYT